MEPTSIFLPGKFHEERSLVGYTPWGQKELDMTKHSENIKKNLKVNTEALGLLVKTYQ